MNKTLLSKRLNGNATISLFSDGSRIIEADGELKLQYPLNIDIRLSKKCDFGMNPVSGKAICSFCHESATTDGEDADVFALVETIKDVPAGTELAVGVNQYTENIHQFLLIAKERGWIVNATVNQGLIFRDKDRISKAISEGLINGLGISYRSGMKDIPVEFKQYENTVVHVIAGIDSFDAVRTLSTLGLKKILILGEKDFGFNLGKVRLKSESHFWWYRKLHQLFEEFEVVSFDNLALEQLNVKRFVKEWETVYQHEFSFYINAVDKYFSRSSRSPDRQPYMSVEKYFSDFVL